MKLRDYMESIKHTTGMRKVHGAVFQAAFDKAFNLKEIIVPEAGTTILNNHIPTTPRFGNTFYQFTGPASKPAGSIQHVRDAGFPPRALLASHLLFIGIVKSTCLVWMENIPKLDAGRQEVLVTLD